MDVSLQFSDDVMDILEQWSFTGGRQSSFAISVFLILPASSSERPLTRSVMYELEAMALPQPNVLNLTSEMIPFSSTRIWSFMTSPHLFDQGSRPHSCGRRVKPYAGAPTRPVPTSISFLGNDPTCLRDYQITSSRLFSRSPYVSRPFVVGNDFFMVSPGQYRPHIDKSGTGMRYCGFEGNTEHGGL